MIATRRLHRRASTPRSFSARLRTASKLRCAAGAPADHCTAQMASPRARGALVWLRNDLRVTDHEGLRAAAEEAQHLSAVYCLDGASLTARRMRAEGGTCLPRLGPLRLGCVRAAACRASGSRVLRGSSPMMQGRFSKRRRTARTDAQVCAGSSAEPAKRSGEAGLHSPVQHRCGSRAASLAVPCCLDVRINPMMHSAARLAPARRGVRSCRRGPHRPFGSGLRRR